MTKFPISALRSVDLEVPDLAAAERFYTQAWGLDLAGREDGAIYLRGTGGDHHILALHAGPAAAMRSITFRADSVAALHHVADQAAGQVLQPVGPVDWMGGGTGVVLSDNQGRTLRLVHGDATSEPRPHHAGPGDPAVPRQHQQHGHRRGAGLVRGGARLPA